MTTNIQTPIFNEFTEESVGMLLATKSVTPGLVDKINALANSDELSQTFKDNLTTYTTVLTQGVFTPAQYVSAVQYVSYRLMGHDVRPAWEKTFPERHATLLQKGTPAKGINSHASAYNKTKLVNLITEQSLIPSYIINNGYFQEAMDVGMGILRDPDASDKNKIDAMGKILDHTAMPESLMNSQAKDEMSDKGMDIIAQLAASVKALAAGKRKAIIDGTVTTKEVAHMPIYEEGEFEDA